MAQQHDITMQIQRGLAYIIDVPDPAADVPGDDGRMMWLIKKNGVTIMSFQNNPNDPNSILVVNDGVSYLLDQLTDIQTNQFSTTGMTYELYRFELAAPGIDDFVLKWYGDFTNVIDPTGGPVFKIENRATVWTDDPAPSPVTYNEGDIISIDNVAAFRKGVSTLNRLLELDPNNNIQAGLSANPPVSATDTGAAGEIRVDSGFIYVCVATDTWERAPLATW